MIAIASDHGGFELKTAVMLHLDSLGVEYKDYGTYNTNSCNYADYARKVVSAIFNGEAEKGILICSTGIGISIAANRFKNIRCAVCHDTFTAMSTRAHNNANILAMGQLVVGKGVAFEIVDAFLSTEFSNEERHIKRINSIEEA